MPITLTPISEADALAGLSDQGSIKIVPTFSFHLDGRPDGTNEIGVQIGSGFRVTNTICLLSGISGRFDRHTELVRIYPGTAPGDTKLTWLYDLKSGQADIEAWGLVMELR